MFKILNAEKEKIKERDSEYTNELRQQLINSIEKNKTDVIKSIVDQINEL